MSMTLTQEFAMAQTFASIFAKAVTVFGSQAEAEQWLEQPAIGLGQRRPIDLLSTAEVMRIVETFLDQLDYCVYV